MVIKLQVIVVLHKTKDSDHPQHGIRLPNIIEVPHSAKTADRLGLDGLVDVSTVPLHAKKAIDLVEI